MENRLPKLWRVVFIASFCEFQFVKRLHQPLSAQDYVVFEFKVCKIFRCALVKARGLSFASGSQAPLFSEGRVIRVPDIARFGWGLADPASPR